MSEERKAIVTLRDFELQPVMQVSKDFTNTGFPVERLVIVVPTFVIQGGLGMSSALMFSLVIFAMVTGEYLMMGEGSVLF